MMQLILTALITLCLISETMASCPNTSNCRCDRSTQGIMEFVCPPEEPFPHMIVRLKPGRELYFQCNTDVSWTIYDMLVGLKAGPVSHVIFMFCPLPNIPINALFQNLGLTDITKLQFKNGNLSNTLDRTHLSGLNITELTLSSNGITDLPADVFLNTTELKFLDLHENSLKKIRQHIFDYTPNLESLELGGNNMKHIEKGIFHNLTQLRLLNLWGNKLQNLSLETFEGLKNLQSLDLSSNALETLPGDIFAEMPALTEIGMFGNRFTKLPQKLFTFTKNLTSINLNDNRQQLKMIPPASFANLTKLKLVFLKTCNLTSLPEDTFWNSRAITNISLTQNLFTTLPLHLFRDTTEMLLLDLSYNLLETLPESLLSNSTSLRTLNLSFNRLTTISQGLLQDLEQLTELYLEHNQIFLPENSLGYSPLKNCIELRELYLAHNAITTIFDDWLIVMVKLRSLDLSFNNITKVDARSLLFLSNPISVDLSFNNISVINLENLEVIARGQNITQYSRHITLEGNPLECDCKVYHLLRYFEDRMEPEARSMFELVPGNLTCKSPANLDGVSVTQLNSLKMECLFPFLQDCPNYCNCSMRPADLALIVDCSHLQFSQSPKRLPNLLKFNYRNADIRLSKPNHTELNLKKNSIITPPNISAEGYDKVTHLYLSHNNITSFVIDNIPPNLQVLELDHNNLTHLDDTVLKFLSNKTSTFRYITLHANPWQCNCDARGLLTFLQEHFTKVRYRSNITCGDNSGRFLGNLTISDLCAASSETVMAASIAIAVLGLMIGVLAALYYHYHHEVKVWLYARNLCLWFVTEEELDKDKLYDVFISYSHRDEEFVVNDLVPQLEGGPAPFKLCLHYRDWIAGEWIPNQIARSVDESRRTLVVLSPNFLESVWGRMEFRTAHSQALSEGRARVIVLLYGDVGPLDQLDSELKAYLSMNTYVKWGDPWFWEKLRYALPHPPRVKGMDLKTRRRATDRLELIEATTPPTDTVINPLDVAATNGHATLLAETNGHVNSCFVKSA